MKKVILISALLLSCAPKIEDRPDSGARFDFGPRLQDSELDLTNLEQHTQGDSKIWLKPESLQAEQKLEMIEDLLSLGEEINHSSLKASALAGIRQFRQQHQLQNVSFQDSPYLDAVVGVTEKSALVQIEDIEKVLRADGQKVYAFLEASVHQYPWPRGPLTGDQALQQIRVYLLWFSDRLSRLGVEPLLVESINRQIPIQAEPKLKKISEELAKIRASATSLQATEAVEHFIQASEFKVSGPSLERLRQGRSLAEKVQAIQDAQDVLTVLVKIHRIVDPETSRKTLGKEAPELYEFMTSVSDVEGRLKCLENQGASGCRYDGVGDLAKRFKILPEIDRQGVQVLRKKIDEGIRDYLITAVDEEILLAAPAVPGMLIQEIQIGLEQKLAELQKIRGNFKGFVKSLAQKWSVLRLPRLGGQIRGLEQNQKTSDSGSELIGQGLFVKTQILNQLSSSLSAEEKLEWSLEHINKLLALSGSVTKPLDMKMPRSSMSLEDMLASHVSFAVPDRISLVSAYVAKDMAPASMDVSVIGQARLLRGLAESIKFLKDWEETSFDSILGQETFGQFYSGVPGDLAHQKVFPKDTLIALPIGNAAVILKNLLKELSPVFVLTEENRIIWTNKYNAQLAEPTALAGVVDLKSGQRDIKVSAQDVAEYITALVEFHKATDSISETKSEKLPIEDLLEARQQVQVLVIGLANFLSHKMRPADDWVHDTYFVKDGRLEQKAMDVMTQWRAISALIKAYELTGLAPYAWTAKDLYFKLNKEAFDLQRSFYQGVDNLKNGVEVLKILRSLRPLLEGKSQDQLNRIILAWTRLVEHRLK